MCNFKWLDYIGQTKRMVDAFLAAGGKYFDTAFVYEGSEEATGKALCSRYPRNAYYLATKLNASAFACKSAEEARREIEISLERTGAGFIDFYCSMALTMRTRRGMTPMAHGIICVC